MNQSGEPQPGAGGPDGGQRENMWASFERLARKQGASPQELEDLRRQFNEAGLGGTAGAGRMVDMDDLAQNPQERVARAQEEADRKRVIQKFSKLSEGQRETVDQLIRQGADITEVEAQIDSFQMKAADRHHDVVKRKIERIDTADSVDEVKEELATLKENYIKHLEKDDRKKFNEFTERIVAVSNISDLNTLKEEAKKLIGEFTEYLQAFKSSEERPREIIHSIEDLARLIMDSEADEWREGGAFELIDAEGRFHPENFLAWFRSRIKYYDDQDPDDQINLFNSISIPTLYRSISFSEMLSTPKYFMKKQVMPGTQESPNPEIRTHQDKDLEDLKYRILYEVWIFNTNHNNDAGYRASMGQEKALKETLPKFHYNNVYTRDRKRLLSILKLPGIEDVAIKNAQGKIQEALNCEFQGTLGKMHQRALLAYMYLPDRKMFRDVFGHGALKTIYGSIVEQVFQEHVNKIREEKVGEFKEKNYMKEPDPHDIEVDIFGKDSQRFFELLKNEGGNPNDPNLFARKIDIKDDEFNNLVANPELFALKALTYKYGNAKGEKFTDIEIKDLEKNFGAYDIFNIYSQVKREDAHINIVREAIRAGLRKTLEEMRPVPADEKERRRHLARIELDVDMGERWAFKETYWTGISAMNDTNAIGFDKWSNEMNTRDYRMRQGSGRGPYGIPETVWGFKRLTLNFWHALKVRREGGAALDTPLIEVLQGGGGSNMNLDKDIETFDFEGNAQRQWLVDHVMPGFKLAEFLIDQHGMDFDKIFTFGYGGKLIIDWEKARDIIQDHVWHDLRYAFDQPGFDYDKKIRTWWLDYDKDGKTNIKFGERTIREIMFDEAITGKPEKDEKGNIKWVNGMNMYRREGEKIGSMDSKRQMGRNAFAYAIAKELEWHIKDKPGVVKWGLPQLRLIKEYFDTWGYGLHPVDKHGKPVKFDENGKPSAEIANVRHAHPFFSNPEWQTIGEKGNAQTKKVVRNLLLWLLLEVFAFSTIGTIKESGKIGSQVTKDITK
jgi:hypothetical protein